MRSPKSESPYHKPTGLEPNPLSCTAPHADCQALHPRDGKDEPDSWVGVVDFATTPTSHNWRWLGGSLWNMRTTYGLSPHISVLPICRRPHGSYVLAGPKQRATPSLRSVMSPCTALSARTPSLFCEGPAPDGQAQRKDGGQPSGRSSFWGRGTSPPGRHMIPPQTGTGGHRTAIRPEQTHPRAAQLSRLALDTVRSNAFCLMLP